MRISDSVLIPVLRKSNGLTAQQYVKVDFHGFAGLVIIDSG
jgi:hypothetical protein